MYTTNLGHPNTERMTRQKMRDDEVAAILPKQRADRPRGEWNTFQITVKGKRVWVKLNGIEVMSGASLPDMPLEGQVGLQHHGAIDPKTGMWTNSPSLVQFRNIFIKDLE